MKRSIRDFLYRMLPRRLQSKWHHHFAAEDYYIIPKAEMNYAEDNVFTSNSAIFLDEPRFIQAYQLGESTRSWNGSAIRWRAYVACWAARQVANLPGDFVECGVNRGGLARTIVDYVAFQKLAKKFYLVDNFTGLVSEYLSDAERDKGLKEIYSYYRDNSKEEVSRTFAPFPNVEVVQGNVPDVLHDLPITQVSYVSLDLNCTMPEIKAAEHFWDRLIPGGIILLDDYAQTIHSEQQAAFDVFASQRGLSVLALPTGQGILLKPMANSLSHS